MASSDVDPAALGALRAQLPDILEEGRRLGHNVDEDPYLQLDPEGLLRRYLVATESDAEEAARRLRATVEWRHKWNVLECHQQGMGHLLYSEESNPGTEMYFAKSCHVDKQGRPYIVGRVHYANAENMHPWRHLRAGIFVIERAAVEVLRRRCGYASYILDIGEVPTVGNVSGTGGDGKKKSESNNPYYQRRAGLEAPPSLIETFGELRSGMAVLRAAIAVGNGHYPELMCRIIILRSNWLFSAAFRVFSLWVHKRSRDKFAFVRDMAELQEWYDPAELPEEWGGTGWRLDGDGFMAAAAEAYDADPALRPPPRLHRFAGWDDAARKLARADAAERGYISEGSDSEAEATQGALFSRQNSAKEEHSASLMWSCFPCLARPSSSPPPSSLALRRRSGEQVKPGTQLRRRTRRRLERPEDQLTKPASWSPPCSFFALAALFVLAWLCYEVSRGMSYLCLLGSGTG